VVRARKPNRTDLTGDSRSQEPITVATGQPYGDATKQRNAQRAVPIGTPPTPQPPAQAPVPQPHVAQPSPGPGELPFLDATQRPNEPVTAGLPFGPGPGPAPMPATPTLSQSMLEAATHGGSDALANMALGLHSMGF
jgi:hypothetical protein